VWLLKDRAMKELAFNCAIRREFFSSVRNLYIGEEYSDNPYEREMPEDIDIQAMDDWLHCEYYLGRHDPPYVNSFFENLDWRDQGTLVFGETIHCRSLAEIHHL